MSNKYKHGDRVPSDVLCRRLDELAEFVTKGPDAVRREFTMRVPAELDRDADLVISAASRRIKELEAALQTSLPQPDDFKGWYCAHCERGVDASEVTFNEQHQECGRVITDDRPPKASLPQDMEPEILSELLDSAMVSTGEIVPDNSALPQDVEELIEKNELVVAAGSEVNSVIKTSALRAFLAGKVLVPVEPTKEMVVAGHHAAWRRIPSIFDFDDAENVYKAMLTASKGE